MDENNYQQPQYQQPQYQQPQYQQPQYQQQYQYQYQRGTSARAAISLVLGIISVVLSLITYNGWSSGSVATVLTCGVLAMFLGYGEARFLKSGVAKAGFICGIIGISIFALKIVATLFLQLFYSVM